MKKLSYYSLLIGICSLFFFGCDTHEELKDAYIGTWRYSFRENLTWDEITYEEANPQNYILTQYQLVGDTLSNNEVQLYLHKDGERIGAIDITLDGKVYFTNDSYTNYLLYDFGKMDKKFDGYYERYLMGIPAFYKKNQMDWDGLDFNCWHFDSHWCKDGKDGYIINGLGSTKGFLSKIEDKPEKGYKHMVLQIYQICYQIYEDLNIYTVHINTYYSVKGTTEYEKELSLLNLPITFWE